MPFKKVCDLDISLTKNVINKLYSVSCVSFETEPLSETFFYSVLNKRVISSDQDKWDNLYRCQTSISPEITGSCLIFGIVYLQI
jgi:hypothetical protein